MENLLRPLCDPVPAEDDDGVGEDGPRGAEGDGVHGAESQLDLPEGPARKNGGKKLRRVGGSVLLLFLFTFLN